MSNLALSLVGMNFASLRSGPLSGDAPWNSWGPSDWCAWLASWLVRVGGAGMHPTVTDLWQQFPPVSSPQQGDIIRYTYGHVGVVVAVNADGTPQTVEGNTGSDNFNLSYVKHRMAPWTYPVVYSRPSYPLIGSSPVTGGSSIQQYLAPTALVLSSGVIALYSIRRDGNLWGTNQQSVGGSFSTWTPIGSTPGNLVGRPAIVQLPSGAIAAYARTSTGTIVGCSQATVGGSFGPWVLLGSSGGVAGDPAALVLRNGTIAIYVTTGAGGLSGICQTSVGGSFGTWTAIGGPSSTLYGRPAAIQTPGGAIVVYASGTDGYVYGAGQSAAGGAFGNWSVMGAAGGGIASEPTATYQNGLISLFALTTSNTIARVSQQSVGGAFPTWESLGTPGPGANQGAPSATVLQSGQAVVYAHGADSRIYGTTLTSGQASGWTAIGTNGGGVAASPASLQTPSGLITVYSISDAGTIVGSSQTSVGGGFGTWISI
ncbi:MULTISPECIES: CHAP domain-containing protein [unclassified Leifsonia]|uniref:CHAP domain-containing protein n=2 Tax=unclassified Leifsonia TaxID=2663824 RepID=UPI000B7CF1EB